MTARAILVQPKIDLAYCDTYGHYRQHLMDLVASQVQPRLATDRPNLIVFPEDVGLPAAFIGSRAAGARAQTSVTAAYGALFAGEMPPYWGPLGFYMYAMPGLPQERLPALALTDTLWRAFYETMRDIAIQTGATVIASTNVSGAVVPMGVEQLGPEAFWLLSDPDITSDYVYVAADPNVYNTAFVFSPSGDIVFAARKPYLTPLELQLFFQPGSISAVAPLDLGFGRLGILTSKDAWMPDVVDRLSILGANTFVQPEAFFGGWTIPPDVDHLEDWLPDNFLESAWNAVQKDGGFRFGLVPHLTGNLFDLPFDGQSAVIVDGAPGQTTWAYVGQNPQTGFLSVAGWAIPDPGIADPSLSLLDRRLLLRGYGLELLPGGTNANAYVETVVAADIAPSAAFPVQPNGMPGALGRSVALSPTATGEQTRPAIASYGNTVAVVWQDTRSGQPQIYLSLSGNRGRSFGRAVRISPSPNPQRTSAVTVTPSRVVVAWQEEAGGEKRIMVAGSVGFTTAFSVAQPLPTSSPADEWLPALAWTPHPARGRRLTSGPIVHLAFVQTVDGVERVRVASVPERGGTWDIVDPDAASAGTPAAGANQWSPAIAAHGNQVAVTWVDFRTSNWEVMAALSGDSGASYGAPVRVDDGPDGWERVDSDPAVVFASDGVPVIAWTDIRQRSAVAQVRSTRLAGVPPFTSTLLAATAAPGSASWRPSLIATNNGRVAAVWQDFRSLGNDIVAAISRDGGSRFAFERQVDDGGTGPSYQFAPRVAAIGPLQAVVVWEDTRTGRRQIRLVQGMLLR